MWALLYLFAVVSLLQGTPVEGIAAGDAANCWASRWDYTVKIYMKPNPPTTPVSTMDQYVYATINNKKMSGSLCNGDPGVIRMSSAAVQCDAAKQFYIAENTAATMANAWTTYTAQVAAQNPLTPVWHIEACPGLVQPLATQPYTNLTQQCTCIAARDWYLANNVVPADTDPVFHYDTTGKSQGKQWNCELCSTNPVYINDPIYKNCQAALDRYKADAWWAPYFDDTFLAYWNSFMSYGKPLFHTELCTPSATSAAASSADVATTAAASSAASSDTATTAASSADVATSSAASSGAATTAASSSDVATSAASSGATTAASSADVATSSAASSDVATTVASSSDAAATSSAASGAATTAASSDAATSSDTATSSAAAVAATSSAAADTSSAAADTSSAAADTTSAAAATSAADTSSAAATSSDVATTAASSVADTSSAAATSSDVATTAASSAAATSSAADSATTSADTSSAAATSSDAATSSVAAATTAANAATSSDAATSSAAAATTAANAATSSDAATSSAAAATTAANVATSSVVAATTASNAATSSMATSAAAAASSTASSAGSTTGVSGPLGDVSNCLQARNAYYIVYLGKGVGNNKLDPYVHAVRNSRTLDASLCTSDPDPIYMSDPRCQCDAAKLNYTVYNPSANVNNAFSLYKTAVDANSATAFAWPCQACPNTLKQRINNYQYLTPSQTCIAAREDYLASNPTVATSNTDPVRHYEASGKTAGRIWASALCDVNPVYIDDPQFRCAAATTKYKEENVWAVTYYDPFLAFWNSLLDSGKPMYHYELCPYVAPSPATSSAAASTADATSSAAASTADATSSLPTDPTSSSTTGATSASVAGASSSTDATSSAASSSATTGATSSAASSSATTGAAPVDTSSSSGSASTTTDASTTSTSLPTNQYVTAQANCLAARLDTVFRQVGIRNLTKDPYVFYVNNNSPYNASMCHAMYNPIYMNDARCQCDAAKQWYIDENPTATMDNAFQMWVTQVGNLDPNAPSWHCEACPDTVQKNDYRTLYAQTFPRQDCVCIRARAAYLVPNIVNVNNDPVYHYIKSGKTAGRQWDCSKCGVGADMRMIDDPESRFCPAAIAQYKHESFWAKYYYDPFLAYWNAMIVYGRPIWHLEYCVTIVPSQGGSTTGNNPNPDPIIEPTYIPLNCTCMATRLQYWARYPEVFIGDYDPVGHYERSGKSTGRVWPDCDLCTPTATYTPVYITQSTARCLDARRRFVSDYPAEVAIYEDPFDYYIRNYITNHKHQWHAELCTGAVTKVPDIQQDSLLQKCTCLKARMAYWNKYSLTTNKDPVYHFNTIGVAQQYSWDCDCNDNPVYIDDPVCVNCVAALDYFISNASKIGVDDYQDKYLAYWNNYMASGIPYHCEFCVDTAPSTTTGSNAGTTTGSTTGSQIISELPESWTCLQAQNYYLVENPDVRALNFNPINHFLQSGQFAGRRWRNNICAQDPNPIFPNDYCNCAAAQSAFVIANPTIKNLTAANAWEQFKLQTAPRVIWDCSLCTLPLSTPIPVGETCNAAREDYLTRYPNVQADASHSFDPVYYHTWMGFKTNTWNGALCTDNPIKATDLVCNCPEGAAQYKKDYSRFTGDAFTDFSTNYVKFGMMWHCEVCSNQHADPTESATCNCVAARNQYSATYGVGGDPWNHYISTGRAIGNKWDCLICNDTCMGIGADEWTFSDKYFSSGQEVVVPPGCAISLTSSRTLSVFSLKIYGSLKITNSASLVNFGLQQIDLYGTFIVGTLDTPYTGKFASTFSGTIPPPDRIPQGGTKGITVFAGGNLFMHGAKVKSWVLLTAAVVVGATQIQVGTMDWQVGDLVVIGSSSHYSVKSLYNETEIRAITAINGNTITLDLPLAYAHEASSSPLSFDSGSQLIINKFTEVGLLSRNIELSGDTSSHVSSYGAHVTALTSSRVYVSGIGLKFAGQRNDSYYRYPFEWDTSNADVTGQYFRQSTIYQSYQGCVGIKTTNNAEISNNLCFKFVGHGYALDTGAETGNLFDSNLGIPGTAPNTAALGPIPTTRIPNTGYGSPVFLIRNPNNKFTNNVAAVGYGAGYWIQPEGATKAYTFNATWGVFTGNVAHSIYIGFTSCPKDRSIGFNSGKVWTIEDFTVYGASFGIFPCGTTHWFTRTRVLESSVGFQSYSSHQLNLIAFMSRVNAGATSPNSTVAIRLLDSGWSIDDVAFANYNSASHAIFEPSTSTSFNPSTGLKHVTLINSNSFFADPTNITFSRGYLGQWGTTVYDEDGSMTGTEGSTIVTDHPMMRDASCVKLAGNSGYACPYRYTQTELNFGAPGLPVAAIGRRPLSSINSRTQPSPSSPYKTHQKRALDNPYPSATYFPTPDMDYYRWSSIVNEDYVYTFVMPITSVALHNISMPLSKQGDTFALQFSNVLLASSFTGGGVTQASSCAAVYSTTPLQQRYFFDFDAKILCVRLVANTLVDSSAEYGYTSSIGLVATPGNDITNQPPAPYNDGPNTLPEECKCINASVDYWKNYPDVREQEIDAVYHYQEIGADAGYKWNCQPCQEYAHYVSMSYCRNCTEARENYTAIHSIGTIDPYDHYILYQYYLGYAYHCEACPVPPEEAREDITFRDVSVPLSAALGAVVGVGMLVAAFAAVLLAFGLADYSKHGRFYCGIVIAGAFLGYVSAIMPLPEPTDALCLAFPWLLGLGFTLVYGCLFIKTWALYKVWRKAEKFQKTNLTPMYIIRLIGAYVLVEVIILIVWSIVDRPKARYEKMVDDSYQLQCKSEKPTFWIIFLAVKGAWLIFGATLSVLTSKLATEYNQSKSIGYAIYNIAALLVIAIPLAIALQTITNGLVIIEVGIIVIAFTFTLVSLFFEVWYYAFFPKESPMGMKLASIQTKITPQSATTRSASPSSAKSKSSSPNSSHSSNSST